MIIAIRNGEITFMRDNATRDVLGSFPMPPDGPWILGDPPVAYTGQAPSPSDAIIRIVNGEVAEVIHKPDLRPLESMTFAEVKTFVDDLTAAQLRTAMAWLIYQFRDQLPDDVRNRV